MSVVHSVVRLWPSYLFDSDLFDEPRENWAISYRSRDVNLLRRIGVMRKRSLRIVSNLLMHSSSPERRVARQALEGHTLSWFILPREGQDFIREIFLTPGSASGEKSYGLRTWLLEMAYPSTKRLLRVSCPLEAVPSRGST